jgi:hypothetical protein
MQRHSDERFEAMQNRLESLQRTMMQTSGAIVAALIGVIATQL